MAPVLSILIAILMGMMAVRPYLNYQASSAQNIQTSVVAGELQLIANAAQAYIQANYATVEANCTATAPATITVAMLQSTGYLSTSVSSTNPFGQTWSVQVLQPSAGVLQALVLSSGGRAIPQMQAPAIAAEAGQEGGFIPYANQYGSLSSSSAQGAFGGWSISMTGYTNPGSGHVAALLAFNNGNLQNDYLYRVAVPGASQLNEMQTNLNMGTNNITNAGNVAANTATLAAGNSLTIGSQTIYGDGGNTAIRTGGALFVQSADGTFTGMNVTSSGSMYVSKSVQIGSAAWSGSSISGTGAIIGVSGYAGVSDTLAVGSRLMLGTAFGTATSGNTCSPNGEIASSSDSSGNLMVCVNGIWSGAQSAPFSSLVGEFNLTSNGATYSATNTSNKTEFIVANVAYGEGTGVDAWVNGTWVSNDYFGGGSSYNGRETESFIVPPGQTWEVENVISSCLNTNVNGICGTTIFVWQ